MWIYWLWVASEYWNKTLETQVKKKTVVQSSFSLQNSDGASADSCYYKSYSFQRVIVVLKMEVNIKYIAKEREVYEGG